MDIFVHFLLLLSSFSLLNAQDPELTVNPVLVIEGQSTQACITYSNPPASEVSVVLATRNGLQGGAIAGSDFEPIVETLVFSSTSLQQQCRDIVTLVDSTVESFQNFQVVATIDGDDVADQIVTIQSFDSVTVGFAQSSYSFNEDVGGQVCVVIEEGSVETTVPISVTFTDGTATESDSDYNPNFLTGVDIEFSPGPPQPACFGTTIVPDSTVESDETYTITINTDPLLTLNSASNQVMVTIINDDANCGFPPTLANGNFSINGTAPFMFGAEANYFCDPDFELVGDSMLTCQSGNIWSPATPGTCVAICPPLMAPNNGNVEHPERIATSIATYSCSRGYVLDGQATRVCQSDGAWSGSAPTCREAAQCDPLGDINNGNVDVEEPAFEGDTAMYTCVSGFIVVGDSMRTCGMNGQWSGTQPNCNPLNVLPPGGLTSDEMIGLGVGLGVGIVVVLIVVIVAVVVLVWFIKSKRKDKYVLNYSTVYGNQRKNELTSRPVEPAPDNDYGETGTNHHESAVDVVGKNA